MKFVFSFALLLFGLVPVLTTEAWASPRAEIKVTVDKLVDIVEEYPGDENQNKRREALREVIAPRFDFTEMSKRSLGAHWKNIDESQQQEFITVFSDLLAATYLAHVENVRRGMVTVDSEKIVEPKALVKTTVTNKGDNFPINYKLINREGEWKVYDVIIENIGLVANYRNEFAGIIRKNKFEGLMVKLRAKADRKEA